MKKTHYSIKRLIDLFKRQKIASMQELKDALGTSADATIFRKLSEISCQSSYSHRGRYYTLSSIPQFDELGLWSFRSVWFSKRGTLLSTAEALINESEQGFFETRWRPYSNGKKTPEIVARIEKLMEAETAGDPMTGLKWTRRTTSKIAVELKALGIDVSPKTVARLLKQLGFSLRVNQKKVARTVNVSPQERDAQFSHIAELRELCAANHVPVISADTKKKEIIGNFKNAGQTWNRKPIAVNDHDFRSEADGIAIPYSIYDLNNNAGFVCVGTSYDTPQFAVESIARWWSRQGKRRYPGARKLVILADAGGSNGPRCRAWKYELHKKLCNHYGLTVKVAHYPSGASKWNPVEHRLHSEISKNWAGRPLESFETVLNYINTTTTSTGLKVQASLVKKTYKKGIKISDAHFYEIPITYDDALPRWNYSLVPSLNSILK